MFSSPSWLNAVLMNSKHGSGAVHLNFKLGSDITIIIRCGTSASVIVLVLHERDDPDEQGWPLARDAANLDEPPPRMIRSRTVGETEITCTWRLGFRVFEYVQIVCSHFINMSCPFWTLEVFWHLSPITQSGRRACVCSCALVPKNAGVYLALQQLSPSHTMTRVPAQRAFVFSRKECDLLRSQTRPNPSCFLSVCVLSRCPHNTFP